jgi:hypothetical protein
VARLLLFADPLGAEAEVKFKKARTHAAAWEILQNENGLKD